MTVLMLQDVVLDNMNNKGGGGCIGRSDRVDKEHHVEYLENIAPRVKDSQNDHDSNGNLSLGCSKQDKTHIDINESGGFSHVQLSLPCDGKLDDAGPAPHPQQHDLHLNVLKKAACRDDVHVVDKKVNNNDTNSVAANYQIDKAGTPSEPIHVPINGQMVGSDNRVTGGSSLELEQAGHSKEPSESGETTLISSEHLDKHKVGVSFGKSSSNSTTTLLSKTPASDNHRILDAQNYNCSTQQNVVSEHKTSSKKDGSDAGFVKDKERYEKPRKTAKEVPKSFTSSVKTSNLSKIPGSSNSTKTLSASKESISFSSAKPSLLQTVLSNSMSGESDTSLQPEIASYTENTTTPSELMQRSETVNHLNIQPTLKVNHTPQMHHSVALNSSAAISDEEV